MTFENTFIAHVNQCIAELEDFAAQRKKLESRRLTYDAAVTKAEKTFKKEKDKKEAEEELESARARFEQMSEDVRARMEAIRENDAMHMRELSKFLHNEMKFVSQYLDALKEVKDDIHEE